MDRTGHGAPQAVNVGQSKPEDESATEDSSKLQLGALFSENAQALSTSELKLIMDRGGQSRTEKQVRRHWPCGGAGGKNAHTPALHARKHTRLWESGLCGPAPRSPMALSATCDG